MTSFQVASIKTVISTGAKLKTVISTGAKRGGETPVWSGETPVFRSCCCLSYRLSSRRNLPFASRRDLPFASRRDLPFASRRDLPFASVVALAPGVGPGFSPDINETITSRALAPEVMPGITLDTAHRIEAGGKTTSYKSLPAQNAAKSHAWKTLQDVSFRIKTLQERSRIKSCLLKTLTQIEGRGRGTWQH